MEELQVFLYGRHAGHAAHHAPSHARNARARGRDLQRHHQAGRSAVSAADRGIGERTAPEPPRAGGIARDRGQNGCRDRRRTRV